MRRAGSPRCARGGKLPVLVGGTGLYVRALVDGLFVEPPLDPERRRELEHWVAGLAAGDLVRWAARLDPGFAGGGRQRAARSIEIALLTGHALSHWHRRARGEGTVAPWYVRLTAPRPVLHQRIKVRAEEMVRRGLIEEVAAVLSEGHPGDAHGLDGVGIARGGAVPPRQADRATRWRRRSPPALGSTPSGRRPGSGIRSRGRC